MPIVCPYFQMHQPRRLRRYSVFDAGTDYFEDSFNKDILQRVAERCYLPAGKTLLEQIEATDGAFKVSFAITGVLIDQLKAWAPEVIELYRTLTETGCVEWLGETYFHSLTFLYHRDEFTEQVRRHSETMDELFGQTPRVFRNTELIYNDELSLWLKNHGQFRGVLAEGVDDRLGGRTPDRVFHAPETPDLGLLLKNYTLSDDIAFRFHNTDGQGSRLTAADFATSISQATATATDPEHALCNLFLDYETFGEHHWAGSGIFDFLKAMPQTLLDAGHSFATCSEAIALGSSETQDSVQDSVYACPQATSWADQERNLSAWVGNAMQSSAHAELFSLGQSILNSGDQSLIEDWRCLTVSDHFYYMSTKGYGDGEVHAYFSPYESPYDAYINFMNVLDHLRTRVEATQT